MVDKDSSVPLYLQIQNLIEDNIRDGVYLPGTQVPSELQISADYNVSRMTARKALDNMVSKGILYRRKGKGTYVADTKLSYGLSTMLSFSQTFRAWGYDVVTRVLRQEVVAASPEVQERLELPANRKVIVIRRLRVVEGKPAALHTSFLAFPDYAPIMDMDLSTVSLLGAIKQVSGISVAYTRDSVQADLVSAEDASELEMSLGSPVLKVEGVAFAENGHHTRYTKAVYRGDLFTLMVTNSGEQTAALKVSGMLANG